MKESASPPAPPAPPTPPTRYGDGDASFRAAGEEAGIRRLVDRFFDLMGERPDAAVILRMHPRNLDASRDKLARFLCGWLGGPKLYARKYGEIRLPQAHIRFPIGIVEREAWLDCMADALSDQPMADDFKRYLHRELRVPAEKIERAVRNRDVSDASPARPAGDR